MSAQHTPAPWRFLEAGATETDGNAGRPLTICGPNDDDLANVYSADDTTTSISREEAIANARLIAAAPELLAALIKMREAWFDYHDAHGLTQSVTKRADVAIDAAITAIAKASAP